MNKSALLFAIASGLSLPALAAPAKPVFQSKVVKRESVAIRAELTGAKELFLVATDAGDGFTADWANWMEPVLIKADGSKVKLTELRPKASQVGWGSLGVNVNAGGKPMRVEGKPVEFGFGAHAPSLIAFDLPKDVVAFEAKGGIDNGGTDQGGSSSVEFKVYTERPQAAELGASASKVATERYGLEQAKKNMSTFTAAEGLQPSLIAAEPMIQNPTNIDIDHRGRVWAVECVNYRNYGKIRPEGDRVVILEDTNGDGEADKDKTFFQSPELTNPLGICVLPQAKGTKVIVSAAPNVWLLTDKDGDDVAEEAVKIFKTTGTWDYDHQIHAFLFGPDGKFYFNFGDAATSLTWPDGTVVKDLAGNEITNKGTPYRKGMALRCDIDLETGKASNVETLGWNFRNNYEVTVDSFGTLWQSDNDDDGNKGVRINYVMEYGNYGYTDEKTGAGWSAKRVNLEPEIPRRHWYQNDPGVVPNLLLTGAGSPTGITVNEGNALGAKFTNQMIHCDAGPRTTRAYPVTSDGAGYKAEMIDILTSNDSWYRASDCAIAPDGSLVISDWYDPGVGGHAMGDHEPGKMMGRVYRVSATGGGRPAVPPVDVTSATGAVTALKSPNRATRYMAWTALASMGTQGIGELNKLAKDENPRLRARALGILSQIKGNEVKALTAGLTDSDENVRIFAIRLCSVLERTRGLDTTPLENNAALVAKLLKDTPAVRRQIAIALSGAKDIAKLWTALALQHDGKDRWYLEALGIGAIKNEDACFDAWLAAVGDRWNTPAGRDIIWRVRATKASEYLARLLQEKPADGDEPMRYIRSFDFLPDSDARTAALVEVATAGKATEPIAREALARLKGSKDQSVLKALTTALDSAKGTPQFIELAREFNAQGRAKELLAVGLKFSRDPLAADAVKLIFADREGEALITEALAGSQAADVIDLLAASGSGRAVSRLLALVVNPDEKIETRKAAVQALARTQPGAEVLVKLAREQKFPEALKLTGATALRSVQYAKLTDDINAFFPLPSAQGGKALPPIASLAKLSGDPAKGKVVFGRAESTCVTCHKIGDIGFDVGPGLSEIGAKLPKEAIYEAILNPNAGISMGFETQQFMLKDGNVAAGIVRSDTKEEVLLALPGGATQKLNPKEVAKREKLPTSLMPAGLSAVLSQDDLVNLVEYLSSLKKK